ncbi:unnamed protein product, partial [Hymenolepis diminuta]
ICTHVPELPHPYDSYKAGLVFHPKRKTLACQSPAPMLHLLSSSAHSSLYPSLSLSSILVAASLNTFFAKSTLGVLPYNCCWLLLRQLRIGDHYCRCNLLAANH